jgi:RNA polymerase sigma factor (sigma-70 family)
MITFYEHKTTFCKLIYNRAYQMLRCREDAQDVVEDVVINILQKADLIISKWQERQKANQNREILLKDFILGFALEDCYHKCLHLLRQRRKGLEVIQELNRGEEPTCDQMGYTPYDKKRLDYAERQELKKLLRSTLDLLPEKQYTVTWLAVVEGLSIEEIAKRLKCSVTSVKQARFQAKRRLKELAVETGLADYLANFSR